MSRGISSAVLVAVIGLTLTGCFGGGQVSALPAIMVGVIVSDPATSTRWEDVDQPLLNDVMGAAGLAADVENSGGDPARFAAIADNMIKEGVKVLVIAAPNNQVGVAVVHKAQVRRIPTIDYDDGRPTLGRPSDYFVSFDTVKAGDLQGRGLVRGIRAVTVRGADIMEIDGPRTDPATALLAQGARNVLQPRYDTGAYRLVARQFVGSSQRAGAVFEQLLTANGDHVDGVLAANDDLAAAVITVLREKGLAGKVRVTGLGATPKALTAILRGDQFMTVFRPVEQQAVAVAKLAGALARNDRAAADAMASMMVTDPLGHRTIHAVLLPPAFITLDTIKQVTDSQVVNSRDICVGELALRCDQLGIHR